MKFFMKIIVSRHFDFSNEKSKIFRSKSRFGALKAPETCTILVQPLLLVKILTFLKNDVKKSLGKYSFSFKI